MAILSYSQAATAQRIRFPLVRTSSVYEEVLSEVTSTATDPFALQKDIRVTQRDFRLFLVSVENARQPNDKLRAAAEEYKQKYQ
jgi:uncharacterized protein (DUF1778 family)